MNVFGLLSLPNTTNALFLPSNSISDGSESPPRKAARLITHNAAHSPSSASRSRTAAAFTGPVKIDIINNAHYLHPPELETTSTLQRALKAALNRDNPPLPESHEQIYLKCHYAVVVADKGRFLHEYLRRALEECVRHEAEALVKRSSKGLDPIIDFVALCEWFETQVTVIQSLFAYLDEVFIATHPKYSHIRSLAFSAFKEHILGRLEIIANLKASLESSVNQARAAESPGNETSTSSNIMAVTICTFNQHLITHGQYQPFEKFYLDFTEAFYSAEAETKSNGGGHNALAFFSYVLKRISQEEQRCELFLPLQSRQLVIQVTERALIGPRSQWLASGALPPLLGLEKISELEQLYGLFFRVKESKILCQAFKDHIQDKVTQIVKETTAEGEIVTNLVSFKKSCTKAMDIAFVDRQPSRSAQPSTSAPPIAIPNCNFVYAIDDAFALGFKTRRVKPAELIAKRMDELLRKGAKGDDESFRVAVEDVLQLCRYTDDKDVFRAFYFRTFAKRLLVGKSASDDEEKRVLGRLNEYDSEFENGAKMFNDLTLSRDLTSDFHKYTDTKMPGVSHALKESVQKFSVMVLQQSTWPFAQPAHPLHLPQDMQDVLSAFDIFYQGKHQNRTLFWHNALSTAVLSARFQSGKKELSVSLFQAIVLLLFNHSTKATWGYPDIRDSVGMDEGELKRTLQSLACGKKKILRKLPAGRDINDDDQFEFNVSFTDPRPKIHVNSIQAKETPEEHQRTENSIQDDRKHYLDAAIVRIMKAKKELSYEQLKAETIEAVRKHFVPLVSDIKKRIEVLVEQEYIERKANREGERDLNVYVYVA